MSNGALPSIGQTVKRMVKLEGDFNSPKIIQHNGPITKSQPTDLTPESKPKEPKKPSAIQLRLEADHLDQTSLLNIDGNISLQHIVRCL